MAGYCLFLASEIKNLPNAVRGLRHSDLRVPPVQALFATVSKESFLCNIRGLVFSDIVGGNALTECIHNVSAPPPGAYGLEPSCSQGSGVVEPSDDFIDVKYVGVGGRGQ